MPERQQESKPWQETAGTLQSLNSPAGALLPNLLGNYQMKSLKMKEKEKPRGSAAQRRARQEGRG